MSLLVEIKDWDNIAEASASACHLDYQQTSSFV